MQDLDVIQRQNSQAHERDIPNQQAKGLYVVAEYHGLHYVGYSTHTSEVEANAKACEIGNEVGRRAKVYPPTAIAAARQRAQEAQGVKDDQGVTTEANLTPESQDRAASEQDKAPTIVPGDGGSFAGAGAESSWTDTSTADSDGGSSFSSTD